MPGIDCSVLKVHSEATRPTRTPQEERAGGRVRHARNRGRRPIGESGQCSDKAEAQGHRRVDGNGEQARAVAPEEPGAALAARSLARRCCGAGRSSQARSCAMICAFSRITRSARRSPHSGNSRQNSLTTSSASSRHVRRSRDVAARESRLRTARRYAWATDRSLSSSASHSSALSLVSARQLPERDSFALPGCPEDRAEGFFLESHVLGRSKIASNRIAEQNWRFDQMTRNCTCQHAKLQYRPSRERRGAMGPRKRQERGGAPATKHGHAQQAGNSVRGRPRPWSQQRHRRGDDSGAAGGSRRHRPARRVRMDHAGGHRSHHPAHDRRRQPDSFSWRLAHRHRARQSVEEPGAAREHGPVAAAARTCRS